MRYFWLKEDKRIINGPELRNWYKNIPVASLKWGEYHKISEKNVLYLKENKEVYFPDVMIFPFLMLSEKIQDILKKYEPNMGYRQIVLIEKKHEKVMRYFVPHLMTIDCLSEKSEFNLDRSIAKRIVIRKQDLEDKCIFDVANVKNRHIIVRHDFLESMLRRDAMLNFTEVELEEE